MPERRRSSDPIIEDISEKVDKIYECIHGNGRVGLKTEVDRNTNRLQTISKAFWFLITPLYVGIIGLLVKFAFPSLP